MGTRKYRGRRNGFIIQELWMVTYTILRGRDYLQRWFGYYAIRMRFSTMVVRILFYADVIIYNGRLDADANPSLLTRCFRAVCTRLYQGGVDGELTAGMANIPPSGICRRGREGKDGGVGPMAKYARLGSCTHDPWHRPGAGRFRCLKLVLPRTLGDPSTLGPLSMQNVGSDRIGCQIDYRIRSARFRRNRFLYPRAPANFGRWGYPHPRRPRIPRTGAVTVPLRSPYPGSARQRSGLDQRSTLGIARCDAWLLGSRSEIYRGNGECLVLRAPRPAGDRPGRCTSGCIITILKENRRKQKKYRNGKEIIYN